MKRRALGFTLIEMMATIAVIAIAMSGAFVFFSNSGPDQQVKSKIDQFIAYADHAADYAMVKGETWGMVVTPPKWRSDPLEMGWKFEWQMLQQEYDDELNLINTKWVDVEGLKSIELPPDIEINVTIEDVLWKWEKAPEEIRPIILFYSSGEKTRFEFEIVVDQGFSEPQHVEVDEWGEIVWRERQEMRREIEKELENR